MLFDALSLDTPVDLLRPLIPLAIVMGIGTILVCVLLVIHARRAWRVQSATLQMQKDIADIKQRLQQVPRDIATPDDATRRTESVDPRVP